MERFIKFIAGLFVFTIGLNLVVFGFILDSILGSFIGVLIMAVVLVLSFKYLKSLTKKQIIQGWRIGKGTDITNPDHPVNLVVTIPTKALSLGFLGVGAPGSGKTVSLGVGYLQHLNRSIPEQGWSIIDGKGDIDYYLDLARAGVKPDYFLSSELPGSNTINLMDGEPLDVTDRCTRFLIPTTESTTFYSDEQKATLFKIIPLLKYLGPAVSLRDLYTVLTVNEAQIELLQLAKAAGVDETVLNLARSWFDLDYEDRVSLNKGLINRLYVFVAGAHTDRFNAYQPDINISECMAKGKSIFFHLPFSDFAVSTAVAIVEVFGIEAKNRQLTGPDLASGYPLLFEDYGGFFHSNFGPISSRCRSAKMPLNFTFQSMAHLQKVDSTFMDEIDDTVQSKIFFRVMGSKTAAFAVQLLGEYETRELGQSRHGDRDGMSVQHVRNERITEQNMRELNEGEAYVSTLIKDKQGNNKNPLYKVQFNQPELDPSLVISLPDTVSHNDGDGLGLWAKYMTPSKLKAIHSKINEQMAGEATAL
ncbi:MAG: hypothetical protein OEZ01_08245 [Candidatus Heimdallarchaeota archaeon]|nr:hypothetical protein [Candidatus Heimdallarchaeota archaeon]